MEIKDFEPLFGNWYVDSFIGSGSFGKVYKIKREEFGAVYFSALKWISIPRDDSEMKQLRYDGLDNESISEYYKDVVTDLVNEMQLMSRLRGRSSIVSYEDHSVVPKLNNMGYDIFIRMELLTSLNDYLQNRKLSRADLIRLGINLCEALELCQKYNIIHRDIKPDNIFVAETGEFKLGDFGIARQLEKTAASLSIKGTYYYMAPEVYKGERYNSSVDTYSLGIVLYRLLNDGRLPFLPLNPAPVRQKDRDQSLVRRMSGEQMVPPQNTEGRFGDIVLKACAYDPKDRYSSPRQMREELQAIQIPIDDVRFVYKDGDNLGILELSNNRGSDSDKTDITTVFETRKPVVQESSDSGSNALADAGLIPAELKKDAGIDEYVNAQTQDFETTEKVGSDEGKMLEHSEAKVLDFDESHEKPTEERISSKSKRRKRAIYVVASIAGIAIIIMLLLISARNANGYVPPTPTEAPSLAFGSEPNSSTMASRGEEDQVALIPVNTDHRIVIDSIYSGAADVVDEFRWGAAIDSSGTVWIWDQNDYVARPSKMTDVAAIYAAGVDWSARLFVVKNDGTVWWTELYWENKTLNYGFQKISGLENITDLEIIDSFDLGLFALDTQGQVWVYGNGKYGVFGKGADEDQFMTPAVIKGLPPIQKIQCIYKDYEPGYSMAVAQAISGEFYYWGTNLFASGLKKYSNTPTSIDFVTTSSNWSLFESVQVERSVYFAWLDERGSLSIYKNNEDPTIFSELGSFVYQHGGVSGLYLLDENGSVYGYGYYTSGCPLTGAFLSTMKPAKVYEIADNQSIISVAFGGWETTALYNDGRIGIWEQSDENNTCITDVRFIQDEAGDDFKLAMSATHTNAEGSNSNDIQIGDVTLTVESTCDYSVNLIPMNEYNQFDYFKFEGLTFDTNQIIIEIMDDSFMMDYFGYLGVPINGAKIQLFNTTNSKIWQSTLGEFQGVIIFDTLIPGTYYYTVACEGYDTYTSPEFKVEYSSGKDNDSAYMQCILHPSGSDFSNGVIIQVTDLKGNLIASKQMNEVVLHPCAKYGSSYRVWSGITLGDSTNQEGILGDLEATQFSFRRGSMAILTLDGITVWDGDITVKDQYILIRAE